MVRMKAFAIQIESSEHEQADAWRMLGRILLHTGKDLTAVSAEDIFELRAHNQNDLRFGTPALGLIWKLLSLAILPEGSTLRDALRLGQRTPAELVDRYGIALAPSGTCLSVTWKSARRALTTRQ